MELWQYEQEAMQTGYHVICGCDEAGAGPLAGPVYAAAVVLPFGIDIPDLTDSKKLTEKKREQLFFRIRELALAYAVTAVTAEEIDQTDILSARMKAMQQAIDEVGTQVPVELALIDGNRDKGKTARITTEHRCIVKGDSLSASIAAASILAKVSRDRHMEEMGKLYPEYGFEKHKGYGTRAHLEALRQYGPSAIHRRTFKGVCMEQ